MDAPEDDLTDVVFAPLCDEHLRVWLLSDDIHDVMAWTDTYEGEECNQKGCKEDPTIELYYKREIR